MQSARGGGRGANARIPGRAGREGGLCKGMGRGRGQGGWVQWGPGRSQALPRPHPHVALRSQWYSPEQEPSGREAAPRLAQAPSQPELRFYKRPTMS